MTTNSKEVLKIDILIDHKYWNKFTNEYKAGFSMDGGQGRVVSESHPDRIYFHVNKQVSPAFSSVLYNLQGCKVCPRQWKPEVS